MRIKCPYCGERALEEFTYRGDATVTRPFTAPTTITGRVEPAADFSPLKLKAVRQKMIDAGTPVILEIELQGARQIRKRMPEAVGIFIAPPSEAALRGRLVAQAGATMTEIVTAIQNVTEIMGRINASTQDQAIGIAQLQAHGGVLRELGQVGVDAEFA